MTNSIYFSNLHINLEVNRVAFSLFGLDIYWYAIIIVSGFLLGAWFCASSAKKRGVNPDDIWNIALYGLVFGIICARLYYVAFDFSEYKNDLLRIFNLRDGGIAIYGAIIGAVITAFVYCKRKKLPTRKVFDLCAPGLFIGQAIGRWGNFVNAEVYGKETKSLFAMSINMHPSVHPLFLYESVWNVIGLIIILLIRDKTKKDGQDFCFYIAWYSLGRLFLEGMRQPQYILYLIDGKVGISQAVAVVGILVGVVGFVLIRKTDKC